jgi:hypothetical protein
MARECLSELKQFLKTVESQKMTKIEVANQFSLIGQKYCGENFCNIDAETRKETEEFVDYLKKNLSDMKRNIKGGKKSKRYYKNKNKSRKNKRGGNDVTDALLVGTMGVTWFATVVIGTYCVMKILGLKPKDLMTINSMMFS